MDKQDDNALHTVWMKRAIRLAKRGIGSTHPNPRVGAVVVRDGELVGSGWHRRAGEPHAEVLALKAAGGKAAGATIYITLEPCSAHGRTPACTEAILKAGIRQVVYGSSDPNPQMAGGAEVLAGQGVEVIGGMLAKEADALNAPFFHFLRTGLPFVIGKAAISLDGKLATHSYHSQWISGAASRRHAHALRAECDAIIVGAGTLSHDNPSLTVRDAVPKGDAPLRVVIGFEVPPFFADCKLLSEDAPSRIYARTINEHAKDWRAAGVQVEPADNLHDALRHLAGDGHLQLLLEGGGGLHTSFFEARLTEELVLYQAPILIGGDAVPLLAGLGAKTVPQAIRLEDVSRRGLDADQLIRGKVVYPD